MTSPRRNVRLGILTLILFVLLAGGVYIYLYNPLQYGIIPCITYEWTGLYCPGCGAGRYAYSLLHGQFWQAFRYNPLLFLLMPWLSLYVVIWIGDWAWNGKNHIDRHIPQWLPYVILVVVLIYGVVRNIPEYPWELLAPTTI